MRIDKRTCTQLRSLSAISGLLSHSDGSAQTAFGGSKATCAITGPAQITHRDEHQTAKITVRIHKCARSTNEINTLDALLEKVLAETAIQTIAIHHYPRTLFTINITILNDDGAILAVCLNSMMAALVDAGVLMRFSYCAVSLLVNVDGNIMLDGTKMEQGGAKSVHTLAFKSNLPRINDSDIEGSSVTALASSNPVTADSVNCVCVQSNGSFTIQELNSIFDLAQIACVTISAFFNSAIQRKSKRLESI